MYRIMELKCVANVLCCHNKGYKVYGHLRLWVYLCAIDVKSTVQMDVWVQIHRLQIYMHAHMHQTLMDLHLACKHAQTSM